MRIFVNPYSGKVMDLDSVPLAPGGAQWCPDTGQPLNAAAVEHYSYPGPPEDRAKWRTDALARVAAIESDASGPDAKPLRS